MGRDSGFLAIHTSLACRDVDICLIPEMGYELYGERGLLEYILNKVKTSHSCIIVVSEGAGNQFLKFK